MNKIKPNLRRLRAERVAGGYDQEEFAHKLGMCRASYCKREKGNSDITVSELAQAMTVLGLSKDKASIFFTQEDTKNDK